VLRKERSVREERTYLIYNTYIMYKKDFLGVRLCI
jgi:hypothetical protein